MKDYLPDYYRDSRQMSAIMETEGQELDTLEANIQDVENQLTIQKTTWKIPTYEEIFAVTTSAGDTLEQRRARLLSKLRLRSPTTKQEFIRFLEPFANSVEIEQYFSEYLVEFLFSGMKASFETIDKVLYVTMPAHLNWNLRVKGTFEFGSELHYAGGFLFSSLPRQSEFQEGYGFSSLDNSEQGGAFKYPAPDFDSKKGFSNIERDTGGFFGGLYIK
jgi:uncharacterized protein YmfQ (DUF2313 family)